MERYSVAEIQEYISLMKREGLTYLEMEGLKLVRDPRIEEPKPPAEPEMRPERQRPLDEPPSNYTHPDLYPDGIVVALEDYTNETAREHPRRRDPMR